MDQTREYVAIVRAESSRVISQLSACVLLVRNVGLDAQGQRWEYKTRHYFHPDGSIRVSEPFEFQRA